MQEPVSAMTELLAAATELFTWTMTSMGSVITTVTSNPLLLLSFMMTLVGFVVGMFRRVINVN